MLSINTYLFIFVSCVCISACSEEEPTESSPDTVEVTPETDTEIQPEDDAAKLSDILVPEDGLDSDTLCSDPCAEGDWCTPDGECVECVENIHCDYPMWCSDGQCIETLCLPGLVACDEDVPIACSADGHTWVHLDACEEGATCVNGECVEQICVPGEKTCDKLQIHVCNNQGTAWVHIPCAAGQACYEETCEPIRNNVLLIFDTSGSMGPVGGLSGIPCVCGPGQCKEQPFPYCEDAQCPLSRLGMTKKVLNNLFQSDTFSSVNFAMTRFPQVIRGKEDPVCEELSDPFNFDPDFTVGHYASPNNTMTGDDDSHVTPPDGFFEEYLHEILCVPFSADGSDEAISMAQAWVDFDEAFSTTETPCSNTTDCGDDICLLNTATNTYECAGHTNPELRATGSTPLGRSLFYAGEYIRKHMVIEGKSCVSDADCGNENYLCSNENTCFDPLRDCRSTTIVLFTDGVESPETSLVDFFNPLVQAKRLHYGLGCAFDSDCLDESECSSAYTCQGYTATNGSSLSTITYIDGDGANKLFDFSGNAIQATVHVVDMSEGEGETANRAIADHGGGIYYPVGDGSPDLLFEAFTNALDVKANIENCTPSFPTTP